MPTEFKISVKTIIVSLLILLGLWLIIQIRDILALMFFAFILMSAIKPSVEQVENLGVSRILAVVVNYVIIVSLLIVFVTIVIPPLVSETIRLGIHLPQYLMQSAPYININLETIISQVAPYGQNLARFTFGIFSNILTLFTIGVFTFYFLVERNNLKSLLAMFIGEVISDRAVIIIKKVELRLGAWVRGEAILALIIGLASFIGLTVFNVNFALPLAMLAGILEVVPIIGPVISAIPAVIVAFSETPWKGLVVVLLYIFIQQIENNFIVPHVMKKAIGLPPLAILLALMVGGRLWGTVGIILAVPLLIVLQTIISEYLRNS